MITTIVLIRADPKVIPQVAQRLAGIDGVTDVYSVSGVWDLVAIVKVPGIERTQTLTAFRAYSKKDLEQAWDLGVE